jgi:putative lipoprotein
MVSTATNRATRRLVITAALAGCAGAQEAPVLAGTTWRLPGRPERPPELAFLMRDGTLAVAGFNGCNRFTGRAVQGPGDALRLGPLAATRMACLGDADGLEREVMAAFEATRRVRRSAERLELLDAAGTVLLAWQPG